MKAMKQGRFVLFGSLLLFIAIFFLAIPSVSAIGLGPLEPIARGLFGGQLLNEMWAAKAVLALLVFFALMLAATPLFKQNQGIGIAICIIISIVALIGMPDFIVRTVYTEFSAAFMLVLLLAPVAGLLYLNKMMKTWLGESRWTHLMAGVLSILMLAFLSMAATALAGKSTGPIFGLSSFNMNFGLAITIAQIAVLLLGMRSFMNFLSNGEHDTKFGSKAERNAIKSTGKDLSTYSNEIEEEDAIKKGAPKTEEGREERDLAEEVGKLNSLSIHDAAVVGALGSLDIRDEDSERTSDENARQEAIINALLLKAVADINSLGDDALFTPQEKDVVKQYFLYEGHAQRLGAVSASQVVAAMRKQCLNLTQKENIIVRAFDSSKAVIGRAENAADDIPRVKKSELQRIETKIKALTRDLNVAQKQENQEIIQRLQTLIAQYAAALKTLREIYATLQAGAKEQHVKFDELKKSVDQMKGHENQIRVNLKDLNKQADQAKKSADGMMASYSRYVQQFGLFDKEPVDVAVSGFSLSTGEFFESNISFSLSKAAYTGVDIELCKFDILLLEETAAFQQKMIDFERSVAALNVAYKNFNESCKKVLADPAVSISVDAEEKVADEENALLQAKIVQDQELQQIIAGDVTRERQNQAQLEGIRDKELKSAHELLPKSKDVVLKNIGIIFGRISNAKGRQIKAGMQQAGKAERAGEEALGLAQKAA